MVTTSLGAAPQVPSDELARSVVDLKQRLQSDQSIDDSEKSKISLQIQTAETNLNLIQDLKKRIAEDQAASTTAAKRAQGYLADFENLKKSQPAPPNPTVELPEIEGDVAALKQKVEELKVALKDNEQEDIRRTARRKELRPLSDAADKQIGEADTEIQALELKGNSLAVQTRRVVLMTSRELAETQKESYSIEKNRYDLDDQEKTLRYQRDLLSAQLTQAMSQREAFEQRRTELANQKAEMDARRAKEQQKEKSSETPLLAYSYSVNTALADRVKAVNLRAKEVKTKLDAIRKQVSEIHGDFKDANLRIQIIGLTDSIGALLRQNKSKLPSVNQDLSDAQQLKIEMNDVLFEMFDVDKQREKLSRASVQKEIQKANGAQTESALAQLEAPPSDLPETPFDESTGKPPIDELIESRKEALEAVKSSLDNLSKDLGETVEQNNHLIEETLKFREFINERILWVRSNDVLFSKLEIDGVDQQLYKLQTWSDALQISWSVILQTPIASALSTFLVVLLLLLQPRMQREIDRLSQIAALSNCDTFWPTAKSFVLTVMVGITAPMIPLLLGLTLRGTVSNSCDLFNALGPALLAVAWFTIPFEILRRICRPNGLANAHFEWSERSVAILRHNLERMIVPGAAVVFLIIVLRNLDQTHGIDIIERSLFVIAMFGFTFFAWRTFSPTSGIFSEYLRTHKRSWANQLSVLWFSLIIGLPLLLAVLTILGYYFTAMHLADHTYATFVFALVAETIRESLKRLFLVRRRHVHIDAARRKQEMQLQARRDFQNEQSDESATAINDSIEELTNFELEIDENAKQANKLISLSMLLLWGIGFWLIWADVMPALNKLDNYAVWTETVDDTDESTVNGGAPAASVEQSSGDATAAANTPSTEIAISIKEGEAKITTAPAEETKPELERISIRDLLTFLVILIVTLILARNLPSAIEILLLEHLPFDRSIRFAIRTLTSYGIVIIGLTLAFRALSIGWDNVQWLVAALTFGLAFGLQEIVANFVAGIILMFERPIRIGDLITIQNITGVVSKIRIRATTIVDWDRKECVIPNKDFITGRLENWTLSDAINRIVLTVGVAYGSDVEKAKAILLETCKNHPKIVDDPETTVAFELFADSSLNITIRTFLAEIDGRLKVIDELHTQINTAFNAAGIVIAFPQRDLRICSVDEQAVAAIRQIQTPRNIEDPT